MDLMDFGIMDTEKGRLRIVQEMVPGKQITLAHIIANPDEIIYRKLGLDPRENHSEQAIGVLSLIPSEIAIIAADIALKSADVKMEFIDRFTGTLVFTGTVSSTEVAINCIQTYLKEKLEFSTCETTMT